MHLKLLTPHRILIDQTTTKVTGEAQNGSFCLLPRHVDFVTALVPGLFAYQAADGEEILAVDRGVLVKCGDEVFVSTRQAVRGRSVAELERAVRVVFEEIDERERKARSALARLEAAFVTRYGSMQAQP